MRPLMNIYEQAARNRRLTWCIISSFILFFLFIGLGFDLYYGLGGGVPIGTLLALAFGGISGFAGFASGDKLVLGSTHARELDLTDPRQRQWQNVVEEMSIAAGIPVPKTYLIDDSDPNAFATGVDPRKASLVVTRGLLEALNRDELQAVAAHEMSHIRNYDIRVMLVIAVLVGSVALVSDWAGRALWRGGFRRDSGRNGGREGGAKGAGGLIIFGIWLITVILAPLISQVMAMCVSRRREYLADASGAELTRNPAALAAALEKIDSRTEPTRSINQGTAHLCIADPRGGSLGTKEGWAAELFSTHPPIRKRIEKLREMAYLEQRTEARDV